MVVPLCSAKEYGPSSVLTGVAIAVMRLTTSVMVSKLVEVAVGSSEVSTSDSIFGSAIDEDAPRSGKDGATVVVKTVLVTWDAMTVT